MRGWELYHLADVFEDCSNCFINLTCSPTSFWNNEHEIEVIKIQEGEAAMKNEDIEMEIDASRH